MEEKALVSFVIPVYNRAFLVAETLDSLIAQTCANWVAYVVDDGSTDGTQEVILNYSKRDGRIHFLQRPANLPQGGNGARNYGLSMVRTSFLNFMDSDDLLHPEKLEKQLKIFDDFPELDMVTCRSQFFKSSLNELEDYSKNKLISDQPPILQYVSDTFKWHTNAPLIRMASIGGLKFDNRLRKAQEWLFFVQYLQTNPKVFIQEDVLVYMRQHPGRIGNQKGKYIYKSQILSRIEALKGATSDSEFWAKYLYKNLDSFFKSSAKKGYLDLCWYALKRVPPKRVNYLKAFFGFISLYALNKGTSLRIIS